MPVDLSRCLNALSCNQGLRISSVASALTTLFICKKKLLYSVCDKWINADQQTRLLTKGVIIFFKWFVHLGIYKPEVWDSAIKIYQWVDSSIKVQLKWKNVFFWQVLLKSNQPCSVRDSAVWTSSCMTWGVTHIQDYSTLLATLPLLLHSFAKANSTLPSVSFGL